MSFCRPRFSKYTTVVQSNMDKSQFAALSHREEVKADQGSLQERLGIPSPLCDDIVLLAFVCFVQTEPHATEINFLHETLANVAPLCMSAASLHSAEARPIAIIQQHLNASLFCQVSRDDMEDDDARFCKEKKS